MYLRDIIEKEVASGRTVYCTICGKLSKKSMFSRPWFVILIILGSLMVFCMFIAAIDSVTDETSTIDSEEKASLAEDADSGIDESDDTEVNAGISADDKDNTDKDTEDNIDEDDIIRVSAKQMLKDLDSNPLRASKTYKNEYIAVTGKVYSIDNKGKFIVIKSTYHKYSLAQITCEMDKRHEDSIMELDIGDEVTVYGTVYLVGEVLGYGINVDYIE